MCEFKWNYDNQELIYDIYLINNQLSFFITGEQQTVYICTGPQGEVLDDSLCLSPKPPPQIVKCSPRPCPAT